MTMTCENLIASRLPPPRPAPPPFEVGNASAHNATVGSTATAVSMISRSTPCRAAAAALAAANAGAVGPEDPEVDRTFRGHSGTVTALSYSPDMKQLVSSSNDRCLMLWSFRAQLRVRRGERRVVGWGGVGWGDIVLNFGEHGEDTAL